MEGSAELWFPADHPTAAGHFPGNPIIPGALLLDEVVAAMAGPEGGVLVIRAAKFLSPVRPGERLWLGWRAAGPGRFAFECTRAGTLVMSGIVEHAAVAG